MRENDDHKQSNADPSSFRELRLLEEVDYSSELSQRSLARRLGVALGVANLLVRDLTKKGYIRATRAGWKRWVYNLTPAGVARKAHLTLAYVDRVLDHYRRVRTLLREDLGTLRMNADSRLAIYGTTELAELMYLVLKDMNINRIDFIDRKANSDDFLGMPVLSLESMVPDNYVKVMVAYAANVEERCQELHIKGVSPSQVVTLLQNSKSAADTSSRQEKDLND